ncbi:uncharacterized protein LOC124252883 [Haliotis rubra]|uniref:uncharacterized protein LOC124252883 n=1 Tax=Haliotis rubra TaxID=36100 RepID=UPI001EE5340F|nr:uncharacterized protein LOC124252883 [Haliotis rubra]
MVGHTHEDIDQMFSKFSQALHHKSAPTVGKLLEVLKAAYRPENSHSELLRSVWDFRAMFSGCDALRGHSIPHIFKIYMKGSQLTLAYKDWPLPDEMYREIPMNLTGMNPHLSVVRPLCTTIEDITRSMYRDLPKWKESARLKPSEIDDWGRYLQSLSTTVDPEVDFKDFENFNAAPTEERRLPENLLAALQKSHRKISRKSQVSVQRKRRTQ